MKTLVTKRDAELTVKLTVDEKVEQGRDLAILMAWVDDLEKELETAKQDIKARRTDAEERIAALRSRILSGCKKETVAVEDWAFHEEGVVRTLRADTHEEVGYRSMTQEERQLPIDLVGPQESKPDVIADPAPDAQADEPPPVEPEPTT